MGYSLAVNIDCIAPGILLAMPQMDHSYFSRTVILMVEHSAKGSMGLVLNKPLEIKQDQFVVINGLDTQDQGEFRSPDIFVGGPVMPNSGWVVYDTEPCLLEQSTVLSKQIALTSSQDNMKSLINDPTFRARLFSGYAGWQPGQLQKEMTHGAWLHCPITKELVFETPPRVMWDIAIRTLGVLPERVFPAAGIH